MRGHLLHFAKLRILLLNIVGVPGLQNGGLFSITLIGFDWLDKCYCCGCSLWSRVIPRGCGLKVTGSIRKTFQVVLGGGCQLFTDTQAQVQVKESAAVRQTGPRKVRTGGWHMVPILPFSRSTLSHPVNPRESQLPGILVNHPLPANDRQRGGRWSLSRLLGVFAPFSDIDTVRDALMHYRLRCNHQ